MDRKLLADVCNAPGPSGFEGPVQEIAARVLEEAGAKVHTDRMGNVVGLKRGKRGGKNKSKKRIRVMLAAHADEIGMMVRHIGGNGYIRFNPLGGLNAVNIASQHVLIHGRETVHGVIMAGGGKSDKAPQVKDLQIDTGLSKEELEKLVRPGDPITFAQEFVAFDDKILMGRDFDDRLGTFCLLEAMRRAGPTVADIYAVSTVQEEIGTRGAETSAHTILPDLGLAIDGSMPTSIGAGDDERTCKLGAGTGIYVIDNLTVGSPRLVDFLFELGEKYGIACQRNLGGGTDAAKIQRSGPGCLCTTIGAPTRYMHSTVSLCHADDLEATIELLARFAEHAHEIHQPSGY